jgi:tetratricopeptide (TPR) repeat protein
MHSRLLFLLGCVALTTSSCRKETATAVVPHGDTFAELRSVKGDVKVAAPGEPSRRPYPRERISEGEVVELAADGLSWIRRDGGAVVLVAGPARLTLRAASFDLTEGRAFVDTEGGPPVEIDTPRGTMELSDARASLDVDHDGAVATYVLRGSARSGKGQRAGSGELITERPDGTATRTSAISWDDWTGGLATADENAEPAPFGIGTVGARPPGDKGKPRFSLVVQRLDVKVTIDHDFATTEVDETFVNPTSEVVEGMYSFRTPLGAVLSRFGVDRSGDLVWGRVKESAQALAQYESNVYEGSTEDPALLSWVSPGVYSARLYPIPAGASRRVVTRYGEWLTRQGAHGERRMYVYPMAAEGARGSLPRIEELTVSLDLTRAGAERVKAGMGGKREGNSVTIKAFDFVPRADLAVELFDKGQADLVAYRAPHALTAEDAPERAERGFSAKVSAEESDYLLVPLRATPANEPAAGLDLAIVVDTSAATESGALAVARNLAAALLAHLGPDDRAALWAGDASLRPVADGSGDLSRLDAARKRTWLAGLAAVERGGATDIGALLTEAASKLDPNRRGAVVYVGDGQPSVGEVAPKALRERLERLPQGTRVLAVGLGSAPNLPLLGAVARGAPVEHVADAYGAARTALRLLESAGRSVWLGVTADLGSGVERALPRELPAVGTDDSVLVVGRVSGKPPAQITLRGTGGTVTQKLRVVRLADNGDLRRRWGERRLGELIDEGAGRAAFVDIGRRFGLVSPFTSLYVPTSRETAQEDEEPPVNLHAQIADRRKRWAPWALLEGGLFFSKRSAEVAKYVEVAAPMEAEASKEGGTGTRAKGEEGSMGRPAGAQNKRYAVQGPKDDADEKVKRQAALRESMDFGMTGLLKQGAGGPPGAEPAAPPAAMPPPARVGEPMRPMTDVEIAEHGAPWGRDTSLGASIDSLPADGAAEETAIGPGNRGGGLADAPTSGRAGGAAAAAPRARRSLLSGAPTSKLAAAAEREDDEPRTARATTPHDVKPEPLARGKKSGADVEKAALRTNVSASLSLAVIDHAPHPCGAAADLPLDERRILWRERLAAVTKPEAALVVYRQALFACEAPGWRERYALLLYMVERMGSPKYRVALWRALLGSPAAADVVYRATLIRVQSAEELRELHDALGLEHIDPGLLAGMLSRAKTPSERLSLLHSAALRWQDDLELALMVLDAYEDAGDDAGGRAWARRLRRRADATAHVHTSIGEYYFRLSQRGTGAASQRDVEEARRTFGEIVEFASEDPVARRRLGDLLRAHGFYEEALRQYETLERLTPDDAAVPLLLAAAAQGMGRIEEAVRWTEKAASTGSPDGSSPLSVSARAMASAFLAWARDDALRSDRKDEADRLRARAKRLSGNRAPSGGDVRIVVIWSHPELRPALWTNALGAPMPATDNYPLFGVAEATVPGAPSAIVELRLDPEDAARAARLGARATVTAVTGEGTPEERIARLDVGFGTPAHTNDRVKVVFDSGALRAEAP